MPFVGIWERSQVNPELKNKPLICPSMPYMVLLFLNHISNIRDYKGMGLL